MRPLLSFAVFCAAVSFLAGGPARADDAAYYKVRIADLSLTNGKFESNPDPNSAWRYYPGPSELSIHVERGEAYVLPEHSTDVRWLNLDQWGDVVIRLPQGQAEIIGRIDYPIRDSDRYGTVKFKIAADRAKDSAREVFYNAKTQHYERLLARGVPGAAWFRHQARVAQRELGKNAGDLTSTATNTTFRPNADFDDTFSLVSGNRAVSENLQLDRVLPAARGTDATPVALDTIEGVTVKEIDWKPYLDGKSPTVDALAAFIPADQHVVFFPSFESAMQLADEADRDGTPLVQAVEPQSQDVGTIDRYQRQLGLRRTALGRMLGPTIIKSMAVTGGDPYFRMGTDVAIVFEAYDVPTLRTALMGQIVLNTAGEKNVQHKTDKLGDVAFEIWRNSDRSICSYLASLGNVCVVTNSPAQLQRLVEVHQGKSPAIALLDEFRFFRDRYQLGNAGESAFLFLSDATIRRWCGPKWRIADSRRVRDAAVLAELQAMNVPKLAARTVEPGVIYSDLNLSVETELRLTTDGVVAPAVGSLTFMTPIAEMDFDKVTKSEAEAYERWRDGYQRNFSWAFDPIGLRIGLSEEKLAADLTIMPLIDNSDYRQFIDVTKGVKLSPSSGDPHGAPLHFVMAINKDSEQLQQLNGMATFFAPQLKADILSWLGESVALYADDSPMWAELAKLTSDDERQQFLRDRDYSVPIAARIEVSSAFKATAFLAAVRAFIDQVGPGMTAWETRQHADESYVRIAPTAKAIRPGQPGDKLAFYYSLTAEALTISLSEDVIRASIDRDKARGAGDAKPNDADIAKKHEWLGENVCVEAGSQAIQALSLLASQSYQQQMQRLSWGNLPILNEWKRLFPEDDSVALHERLWGVKLVCPGGGEYKWNESWQTFESSVYGHPAEPKSGPPAPPQLAQFKRMAYGLTFEENGLRARGELERAN